VSFADRARRVRHSAALREREWLWAALRVPYRHVLALRSRVNGIPRTINDDTVRLRFPYSEVDSAYERAAYMAFRSSIRPGDIVFDIGANVGLYTLAAARAVGDGGRVFAFEPVPATAAVLQDHIALNSGVDRVEVVAEVVDETSGTVDFWEQGTSLVASIVGESAQTGEAFLDGHAVCVTRPSVSLDDFCRDRAITPDVVKIDAEGAEGRVLRGARALLERRQSRLFLEVHPWSLNRVGESSESVLAQLRAAGYECELIDTDGNTAHYACLPRL
jgi:FkbM family methyltransferase